MSQYSEEIERRRTFAIISHPDAGKTTPVTLSGSQSFTAVDTNLWVRLGAGQLRRG